MLTNFFCACSSVWEILPACRLAWLQAARCSINPANRLQPNTIASPQGAPRTGRRGPQQQVVMAADGRMRRRAVFGDDALPGANGAAGASSDEEGSDEEEEEGSSDEEDEQGADGDWQLAQRQQRGAASAGSDSEDQSEDEEEAEEEEEDDEGMGAAARWKAHMLERAAALFRWGLGDWGGGCDCWLAAAVDTRGPPAAAFKCTLLPPHSCPTLSTPVCLPHPACCSTRGADLHSYIYGTRATADVSWGWGCCLVVGTLAVV